MNAEKEREVSTGNRDSIDHALRPSRLDDFIGQTKNRENLRVFIEAARGRNEALDHVLLHGPPGLGKTTLAQIIARELGQGFRATSGPVLVRPGDLAALLTNLDPQDVLFIDEIHRLPPIIEETLYPALEDFRLDLMIGQGPSARAMRIDLPPFTLVGATTRAGRVSTPMRERFGIPFHVDFYETEELAQIVRRNAESLSIRMTDDGANEIAGRSRGTPRIAGRLLRRVRDIAGNAPVDATLADKALTQLQIDKAGLDSMDRRYLDCLLGTYRGGPAGIEAISATLSEELDAVRDMVEPFLIQEGFVQRTAAGRVAGPRAWTHLQIIPPQGAFLPGVFDRGGDPEKRDSNA